jgi:extradiol dioxygenase family protein
MKINIDVKEPASHPPEEAFQRVSNPARSRDEFGGMDMTRPRFHLAIAVTDLESTRAFYGGILGCREGRSAERWVDFDLHGHQLSFHCLDSAVDAGTNSVDGDAVPIPHFGLILDLDQWGALRDRLLAAKVDFVVEPRIRFVGLPGEQATMFLRDPSGNALEFKAFREDSQIFEAQ